MLSKCKQRPIIYHPLRKQLPARYPCTYTCNTPEERHAVGIMVNVPRLTTCLLTSSKVCVTCNIIIVMITGSRFWDSWLMYMDNINFFKFDAILNFFNFNNLIKNYFHDINIMYTYNYLWNVQLQTYTYVYCKNWNLYNNNNNNFWVSHTDGVHNHSKFVPLKYSTSWPWRATGHWFYIQQSFIIRLLTFYLNQGHRMDNRKKMEKYDRLSTEIN